MTTMIRVPLRDRCRGRWRCILPALGMNPRFLTGKNGPCPLCPGGKDRWRFLGTGGDGTWICTHCGAGAGAGSAMGAYPCPVAARAEEAPAILPSGA